MTPLTPLLDHSFGRSFLITESTPEAASRLESGGILTPADEGVFPS